LYQQWWWEAWHPFHCLSDPSSSLGSVEAQGWHREGTSQAAAQLNERMFRWKHQTKRLKLTIATASIHDLTRSADAQSSTGIMHTNVMTGIFSARWNSILSYKNEEEDSSVAHVMRLCHIR
jgi:GH18 family chitinase